MGKEEPQKYIDMSSKGDILARCKRNLEKLGERYDKPSLDDINPLTYADTEARFEQTCRDMGCTVEKVDSLSDVEDVIKRVYPDAKRIASNVPGIGGVNFDPDKVADVSELDGTDVGIVKGLFGVAENGCIWVPQDMKEKAVCFISENLVILLPKGAVVNNMHEAYPRVEFNDYGFGTFISGPSKTADIAQVLVMGAQAARSLTVILY